MIKSKTPTQPIIGIKSKTQPIIGSELVIRALGAEEVHRQATFGGEPHALYDLQNKIVRRLKSTGGRRGLVGVTQREKIPVSREDWELLHQISKKLTHPGFSVSPAQVASVLLHEKLVPPDSEQPQIIGRVPGLESHRARTQATLAGLEILDVEGVVVWSRYFPELRHLWIIAPNFLDDQDANVFNVVVDNIKERDVQYTYFVRREDMTEQGRFQKLKASIAQRLGEVKASRSLTAVPLGEDVLVWLQTDHVIANPHRVLEAVGFQFFRRADKPAIAIRMEDGQLGRMIEKLIAWVKKEVPAIGRTIPFQKSQR